MSCHDRELLQLPLPSVGARRGSLRSPFNSNGELVLHDDVGPGRQVTADSFTEMNSIVCLAQHPDTVEIIEQQKFEWYDRDGVAHHHYFDVVVVTRQGLIVAYAIRPVGRISQDYVDRLSQIRTQAIRSGFVGDVRFLTETCFDGITKHNAWLMHGSRLPDPEIDTAAKAVVRSMSGILSIDELCDRIDRGGQGFRAVVRLLRSRHLRLMRHERIARPSLVYKAEQV